MNQPAKVYHKKEKSDYQLNMPNYLENDDIFNLIWHGCDSDTT